ncbi:MAG: HAD-IIB family hydrolase [Armatimonadetes bacterium]|nr:HAD-IIB family hydrolase [Armatimonadota bacterium]
MRLIASDLDNTWVSDDAAALEELQDAVARRRQELTLVYVTGRDLALYRELERQARLLEPDYLIASVGADIYRFPECEPDAGWEELLAGCGWCEKSVDRVTAGHSRLIPQPAQFRFKRSYYFEARDPEDQRRVLSELARGLQQAGVRHRLVYSSNRDLDVLPVEAGKGRALHHLRRRLGLQPRDMVVCGDSGNDIDMLDGPWGSVMVANARPELLRAELQPPVFRATEPASRGVVQGLRHFGILSRSRT